jgi:hypothetical protein
MTMISMADLKYKPLITLLKNIICWNRLLSEKLQKRMKYQLVHATILMEDLGTR